MHDIKFIRENPESFDQHMVKRGDATRAAGLIALDEKIRAKQTELQNILSRRNEVAKLIGEAKRNNTDAAAHIAEGEEIKKQTPALETELSGLQDELNKKLICIPNLYQDTVPQGKDETENVELKRIGTPTKFPFAPKSHFELGEKLGLMDFERTAKISGARFVTLLGMLAKMERALRSFMLDIHTEEFGYTEVHHPALVREDAPFGVGQLPKFAEDLFKTTNDFWLISTSEVFLSNLVADMIVPEEQLPMRLTAYSSCFRSEAGSAGKDTRGMMRLHQFTKVELVSITSETESFKEHERMLSAAEEILKRLELPYRVVTLCTGDTGFQSSKTYDIEVWLPSENRYREISSCSNCLDFQARRMKARYKKMSDKKNYLVHTLNGSGLAIGRTIIAILENYQNADGSITIPEKLRPYMGGIEKIG